MAQNYIRGRVLGQGTWGCVYQAEHITTRQTFAIKRIEAKHDGLDFTAIREVKYLQELMYNHYSKYIVQLVEVFVSGTALHLVLEFCPHDLSKILSNKSIVIKDNHIKCYMLMMMRGLEHCHRNYIIHRDLKPSNLLIRSNGVMVLADFGLARNHASAVQMTSQVVSLWYRPPELLFGAGFYSAAVDIWAAGCIFAEIFLREPLFPGETDTQQLGYIFNVFGTPNDSNWPNVSTLPGYVEFEHRDPLDLSTSNRSPLQTIIRSYPSEFELLIKLLLLDPRKRPNASQVLSDLYFFNDPKPCNPSELHLPTKI